MEHIRDDDLPLPRQDFIDMVALCVGFGAFTFNNQEYVQHKGLAMGSPLSAVLANLFMETLEVDHYFRILGRNCSWLRYVDDILVVVPVNVNIDNKLRMLNNVHSDIHFTVEEEREGILPFLDTVIRKTGEGVKFSVYRKPTNKDDFIHYLSAHNDRVKSGVVIGFFLRAYRICSEDSIDDEIRYIINSFKMLKYPEGLILKLKHKAQDIIKKKENAGNTGSKSDVKRYVCVPNSSSGHILDKQLSKVGLKIATSSGRKIGELTKATNRRKSDDNSVIYKIPCNGCEKVYIGETSRGIEKRLYEHKADVRKHNTANSLVLHIEKCNNLPKWGETSILVKGLDKKMRKALEAAHICISNVSNHREGFMKWSRWAASHALRGREGVR